MRASDAAADRDYFERRDTLRQVRNHRSLLIVALFIGLAAPLLRVYPGDRVGWRWSSDLLLPPLCVVRQYTGLNCPGCGLTRCFVYLAQGDLSAAWQMNRVGVLLAALVLVQIPYRLLAMRYPRRLRLPAWIGTVTAAVIAALLFLNWVVNLLTST